MKILILLDNKIIKLSLVLIISIIKKKKKKWIMNKIITK